MIVINNKDFRIKRRDDITLAGQRSITLVVVGDVREFNDKDVEIVLCYENEEEILNGHIILPHYCEFQKTTMFIVYIEEE